jgi:hypothetical protein
MTREVLNFLRNEVRLQSANHNPEKPWQHALSTMHTIENIVCVAAQDGMPAYKDSSTWRNAEFEERNGEISLMVLLDSWARAAYPISLIFAKSEDGGWEPGPVHIQLFEKKEVSIW